MDFEQLSIQDRKIIVGIDFGTTYSGVAWAETRCPDRRNAITSWPVSPTIREGETSDKVPTKLRYTSDGRVEWGFSIPLTAPSNETIEWFKLDLDSGLQSMGEQVQKNAAARGGRDVDTLVTDYISALGDHLKYILRQKIGEDAANNMPLEFVVTVPAIWSDLAKDKTKKACQAARGLQATKSPIHLISEPEAAAIYALHGLDPHGLAIGDSFVICDAGGGTVDLISYTVLKLKPVLEVQEATPGTGALCGSTYVNLKFQRYLTKHLGKLPGFDDEVMAEAMEKFEKTIKRQYTMSVSSDETYLIPVGGLENNKEKGIHRGRYTMKASDVRNIFEPVVAEVIKLVEDQIKTSKLSKVPIKAVLLVGGFGSSNYLKERLRNAIDRDIQVLQPPDAWLAVVHGAVMKGLANSAPEQLTMVKVQNRKARKHYGIVWNIPYVEEEHLHLKHKRRYDDYDGSWRVEVMNWFIKRGETVAENTPFYTAFFITKAVADGRIKSVTAIVYCDRTPRKAPMEKDNDVERLCRLNADLSHIPEHLLEKRQGADGRIYYKVRCQIESVYLSASTQYTLIYDGQRYDSVTAEYA
ncbi:chaperone protein DnaK [Rhypophila decipiens]